MIVFLQSRLGAPDVEIGRVVLRHGRLYPTDRVETVVASHAAAGRSPEEFIDRYRSWSNGYILSRETADPDWRGTDYRRMFDSFVDAHSLDIEHDNWPSEAEAEWRAQVWAHEIMWNAVELADLDDVGVPNCSRCLVPMDAVGEGEHAHLRCPACGSAPF